jgi:hypothetical protein
VILAPISDPGDPDRVRTAPRSGVDRERPFRPPTITCCEGSAWHCSAMRPGFLAAESWHAGQIGAIVAGDPHGSTATREYRIEFVPSRMRFARVLQPLCAHSRRSHPPGELGLMCGSAGAGQGCWNRASTPEGFHRDD